MLLLTLGLCYIKIRQKNYGLTTGRQWIKEAEGNGIYSLGSDDVTIVNNLIINAANSGFHSYSIPLRMIDGRAVLKEI